MAFDVFDWVSKATSAVITTLINEWKEDKVNFILDFFKGAFTYFILFAVLFLIERETIFCYGEWNTGEITYLNYNSIVAEQIHHELAFGYKNATLVNRNIFMDFNLTKEKEWFTPYKCNYNISAAKESILTRWKRATTTTARN